MNEAAGLELYLPYVFLAVYYIVMFRLWLQPPPTDPLAGGGEGETAAADPGKPTEFQTEERQAAGAQACPEAQAGLAAIHALDARFDEDAFLKGAARAYEIILSAYAEGNIQVLEGLLDKGPLSVFSAVIMQRRHRGLTLMLYLVGIAEARIVNAVIDGDMAEITLRFVSEAITSTRDGNGNVVEGDSERIVGMADRWIFRRNVRSSDPNWSVCATGPA